jgi:creatinine amidohydrolase
VVVPVGSTEQHGPHLPLDTDTVIAVALAGTLGRARKDVLVTAPLAIGASGEHAGFHGTLSIGSEVLEQVLVELVRSAEWAAGVVLVNGHGGNATALAGALTTLRYEQRNVLVWWPSPPEGERGDAHAGWLETSVMLHLAPHLVRTELFEPGETRPLTELMDALREHGVLGVSPNGVLGDPTGASAADGNVAFDRWAADLTERFEAWAR